MTTTRQPTSSMLAAYELGVQVRAAKAAAWDALEIWTRGGRVDRLPAWSAAEHGRVIGDGGCAPDPVLHACYLAGEAGAEMPTWSTGWRYGAPPTCGASYNHRDGHYEAGVSMMQVDGCDHAPDGTYAIFNRRQRRVRLAGWLVTHSRGTDGEPLLVGVEVLR